MPKDVTLATVFDLFLDSLSGSVEKLKSASCRHGELMGRDGPNKDAV